MLVYYTEKYKLFQWDLKKKHYLKVLETFNNIKNVHKIDIDVIYLSNKCGGYPSDMEVYSKSSTKWLCDWM